MRNKILWLVILLETAALIAACVFIARHLSCYHDQGKPRMYYYGPRGGKYYINAAGTKVYVRDKKNVKNLAEEKEEKDNELPVPEL